MSLKDFVGVFACFSIFANHVLLNNCQPNNIAILDFSKGLSFLPGSFCISVIFEGTMQMKSLNLDLDLHTEHQNIFTVTVICKRYYSRIMLVKGTSFLKLKFLSQEKGKDVRKAVNIYPSLKWSLQKPP